MRHVTISAAALLGFSVATAAAQVPLSQNPDAGARPGHEIGVGDSLPRSDKASNITAGDARSTIAPTLPPPAIGDNATTVDYLRAARASLVAGHTGATQQSLEMAETRALDHSVPPDQADRPNDSPFVANIRGARRAIGDSNRPRALELIDLALAIQS
jgi:hypothetical protein